MSIFGSKEIRGKNWCKSTKEFFLSICNVTTKLIVIGKIDVKLAQEYHEMQLKAPLKLWTPKTIPKLFYE